MRGAAGDGVVLDGGRRTGLVFRHGGVHERGFEMDAGDLVGAGDFDAGGSGMGHGIGHFRRHRIHVDHGDEQQL